MTKKVMTLEQLLTKTSDGDLLDIQEELLSGVVPATGYTHSFCRKVNRMIDKGELCINPTTYRKVYLPTLAKAAQKELARRYTSILKGESYVAATKEESCGQLALDLVGNS
jgi:hypothetical protein